jgi:hypothetical protein
MEAVQKYTLNILLFIKIIINNQTNNQNYTLYLDFVASKFCMICVGVNSVL